MRSVERVAVAAALFALAAACSSGVGRGTPAGSERAAGSPLKPCRVEEVPSELLCGKLTVFENRESRSGRTIDLNVVVLPALEPGPKGAPLFNLAGGPGASSTADASLYASELGEYRRRRDVVLVDQRGTGGSNPLHCAHPTTPQHFLDEMYPVEYVKRCREEPSSKADLTQYTSANAADDLDDVRAWLGYPKIDLFGLSYGTRLALVYLRRHGERVRSVVLMGVAPPSHRLPLYLARDAQRALDLMFDECAADADCHRAFPRAREELNEVQNRLARAPARAEYRTPDTGETITVEIRGGVFAEKIRKLMYAPPGARRVPMIVHRAAEGDFGPFLRSAIPPDRTAPDFVADGLYLSVTCAEDVPRIDAAEIAGLTEGTFLGDYRVFQQRRACEMWPRGTAPAEAGAPVESAVPALILSGFMDPITPPSWGEEVARHLPNGRHVVIRHHAHVPDGLTHMECLDGMILGFLDKGEAASPDVSCADGMLPPAFVLGEESGPR